MHYNFDVPVLLGADDINSNPITLIISASDTPETRVCHPLRRIVQNDDRVEDTEYFSVEISSASLPEITINSGDYTVSIEDKDGITVVFLSTSNHSILGDQDRA